MLSPPPPSPSSPLRQRRVPDDCVGDTLFSKLFICKSLHSLYSKVKELFENVDDGKRTHNYLDVEYYDNMCLIWDMTNNEAVCNYLLEIDSLNIMQDLLTFDISHRMNEIIYGIIGNMTCFTKICEIIISQFDLISALSNIKHYSDGETVFQIYRSIQNICKLAMVGKRERFLEDLKAPLFEPLIFVIQNTKLTKLVLISFDIFLMIYEDDKQINFGDALKSMSNGLGLLKDSDDSDSYFSSFQMVHDWIQSVWDEIKVNLDDKSVITSIIDQTLTLYESSDEYRRLDNPYSALYAISLLDILDSEFKRGEQYRETMCKGMKFIFYVMNRVEKPSEIYDYLKETVANELMPFYLQILRNMTLNEF